MFGDVRFHTSFGPLLLGLLSRSQSRVGKTPGRSPMCSYWQPRYGQLTALKIECDCIAGAGVKRSAQRSAVGNIIWLSMHPRISVLTKSSIRMSALHVWWCKISHQLWSSPPRSPQSLPEPSRKNPWEESNVFILTATLWSIDSFKNRVWLYRGRRCQTHWEKKEIKRKNKTNTL